MSNNKLFEVTLEVKLFVVAESKNDAIDYVISNSSDWRDELDHADVFAEKVTELSIVPSDWVDALPYNGHGENTIKEILSSNTEEDVVV
jgi:hypothetical protein